MKKALKIIIVIGVLLVIFLAIFLIVYGILPQDSITGGSSCSGGSCTIG